MEDPAGSIIHRFRKGDRVRIANPYNHVDRLAEQCVVGSPFVCRGLVGTIVELQNSALSGYDYHVKFDVRGCATNAQTCSYSEDELEPIDQPIAAKQTDYFWE